MTSDSLLSRSLSRSRHYVADLLVFQIDGNLYPIPVNILKASTYFTAMIEGYDTIGQNDGQSDDTPIVLGGISRFEMDAFLDAVYSRVILSKLSTVKEFSAVLRLATLWSFDLIREYAILQIDERFPNQDLFDRLDLALQYNVDKWKLPVYSALCLRKQLLTTEEGSRLGLSKFAAISRIREQLAARNEKERNMASVVETLIKGEPHLPVPSQVELILSCRDAQEEKVEEVPVTYAELTAPRVCQRVQLQAAYDDEVGETVEVDLS